MATSAAAPLRPWPATAEMQNVYVAGLPPGFSERHLTELFGSFGSIVSFRVCQNRKLGGLGYGFVKFGTPGAAEKAVKQMNGSVPDGFNSALTVKLADQDKSAIEANAPIVLSPDNNSEVFVIGLDENTNEEVMRTLCASMGNIIKVQVSTVGRPPGQGFAFVRFRFPEEAKYAIRMLDGKAHGNFVLRALNADPSLRASMATAPVPAAAGPVSVGRIVPPGGATGFSAAPSAAGGPGVPSIVPATDSLFVSGLPPGSTQDSIAQFFGGFGHVVSVSVLDAHGKKGDTVAMVRMASVEEARWCVEHLSGRDMGGGLQLVLRFSDAAGASGSSAPSRPASRFDSPYGAASANAAGSEDHLRRSGGLPQQRSFQQPPPPGQYDHAASDAALQATVHSSGSLAAVPSLHAALHATPAGTTTGPVRGAAAAAPRQQPRVIAPTRTGMGATVSSGSTAVMGNLL